MRPISVVIPAYNEAKSIAAVIESVAKFMRDERIDHEIIVVDDFSSDDTSQSARRAGATVISHPINQGYGAALTTGIKASKYGEILIMDADGTYPIAEVKKLLPYIDDFDMVIGARQGKHYHGSPVKRISRGIFYVLISYVTGDHVPDANSGLRIFRKDVVMQFEPDFCSGFSFTTTITLVLLCNKYLLKFVPIDYHPRVGSKSKVKYLRDTARTVQILIQTVSYYIPLKAFLPFSIISMFLAFVFTVLYFVKSGSIFCGISAVLTFLSSMAFLGLGLIAYSIVRGKKS